MSIITLLLLCSLVSLHSFTLTKTWMTRRLFATKTAATPVDAQIYKLNEVYIGNLPATFDVPQLKYLLRQSQVSDFNNASVLSYKTIDGEQYGKVEFATNELASSAVSALQGAKILGGRSVDVSLMPNVSMVCVSISNGDANRHQTMLDFISMSEDVYCIDPNFRNRQLLGAYITCFSPPRAARVYHTLSGHDWKHFEVRVELWKKGVNRFHTIIIKNLDPKVLKKNVAAKLNEVLGPNEVQSLVLKRIVKSKCLLILCDVIFVTSLCLSLISPPQDVLHGLCHI